VVDTHAYLSADTRSAVAAAVRHARGRKLTVLVADAEQVSSETSNVRLDTLRFHLNDNGYADDQAAFLTETGQNRAAAIADACDTVGAQLVVLSAGAVHGKAVDCNLLCEFLTAPLLLVP
jgi:hypothetical protein